MRHGVLFSAFCPPTEVAGAVLEENLRLLAQYHGDSRVFVGLQPDFDPQAEALLRNASFEVGRVDPRGVVDSDLSGYVRALDLLRRSGDRFDVLWFAHTKGASRKTFEEYDFIREILEREFWSRRADAERVFADDVTGVIGYHLAPAQFDHQVSDAHRLRQMVRLTESFVPFTLFQSHPIFRGEVVHRFLDRVDERFFSENLLDLHFDRFFFESTFPSIATMLGYEPHAWSFDLRDPRKACIDEALDLSDPDQGHGVLARELAVWRGGGPHVARAFPRRSKPEQPTTSSERGRCVAPTLRIAVVQLAAPPVDRLDTEARIETFVGRAADEGARLVALPELWSPEAERTAELVPYGPTIDLLLDLAKARGVGVAAGVLDADRGGAHRTYVVCLPDGAVHAARSGRDHDARGVFDTSWGVRLGAFFGDEPHRSRMRAARRQGADLVLVPCRREAPQGPWFGSGPFVVSPTTGRLPARVADTGGRMIARTDGSGDGLAVADVDLGSLRPLVHTGPRSDPSLRRGSEARRAFGGRTSTLP